MYLLNDLSYTNKYHVTKSSCIQGAFSSTCSRGKHNLQSTGRSGQLAVSLSSALMCAIMTVGLRVTFLSNTVASTMCTLLFGSTPPAMSTNVSLLRTCRILTLTPLSKKLIVRTHRIARVEGRPVSFGHLRLHEQVITGQIQTSISRFV